MNQKELKALISLLDDEDPEIYRMVSKRITDIGVEMIPLLELEWEKNSNPLVQYRIENITHDLQFLLVQGRLEDWKQNNQEDLLKGLWAIATYQYPDVELEQLRTKVDQLFFQVWPHFDDDLHPFDQVKILNGVFFREMNFSANTRHFHSPSNSFINTVLDSKKGNPISLCIVYLMIAQKLKMPVYGVNLPNLFVLTYKDKNYAQFYINVYNRGLIFSMGDIENYVRELHLDPVEAYFQPASNLDILKRVLLNLTVSYEKASEKEKVKEIAELAIILESSPDFIR